MVLCCHLDQEMQRTPMHEGPRITLHRACSHLVIPGPGLPLPALYAMYILCISPQRGLLYESHVKFLFCEFFIYALHIYVYNYSYHSFKQKLSELTRVVQRSEEEEHAGGAGIRGRE